MPGFLYETLDGWSFQQLCQALLSDAFPGTRSYPINQADGGRDAELRPQALVFQCKWTAEPAAVKDPVRWILDEVKKEELKIRRLHSRGLRRYILLTNISGSAVFDKGEIDKLDSELERTLQDLTDLEKGVWWRETIDGHLTSNIGAQWKFPQVLSGTDAMHLILHTLGDEGRERRERSIRAYIAAQYDEDTALRFKQAYAEPPALTDLFVDVPCAPSFPAYSRNSPTWTDIQAGIPQHDAEESTPINGDESRTRSVPTAAMLASRSCADRVQINGAPGQGKSTLLQFVCQLHRSQLMGSNLSHFGTVAGQAQQRIPFKVALNEYMQARRGFRTRGPNERYSIERYISEQIRDAAGGSAFDVDDFHSVATTIPVLIALDALDEVADEEERSLAVEDIQALGNRLAKLGSEAVVAVTSRPAQDSSSATLPQDRYFHLSLIPLPAKLADEFVGKWIRVQKLPAQDEAAVTETWTLRRQDRHIQNLATNPMQLSILLQIINARGPSLPDRRTLLYDDYIRTLMDREADKDRRVAKHRDILVSVHGFVAFALHSNAEASYGDGTIKRSELLSLLREYLSTQGRSTDVEELFKGVERVVALVSRKQGTFEFEVQPLREYFCGRYLYDSAPYAIPGMERKGLRHDRLFTLLGRSYWQNVLRFFVGCFHEGELVGVVEMLRNYGSYGDRSHFLWARRLVYLLISDQLFADSPRLEAHAAEFAFDRAGRHAIGSTPDVSRQRTAKTIASRQFVDSVLTAALESHPPAVGDLRELERICTTKDLSEAWFKLGMSIEKREAIDSWLEIGSFASPRIRLSKLQADQILENFEFDARLIANFAWRGVHFTHPGGEAREVVNCALNQPIWASGSMNLTPIAMFLRSVAIRRMIVTRGATNSSDLPSRPAQRVPRDLDAIYREITRRTGAGTSVESTLWVSAVLKREFGNGWHSAKLDIAAAALMGHVSPPPQLKEYFASTDEWHRRLAEVRESNEAEDERSRRLATWLLSVLTLAGPSTLHALAPECEDTIDCLDRRWLADVINTVQFFGREFRHHRIHSDEIRLDLFRDYPLTGICLVSRMPGSGYEVVQNELSRGLRSSHVPTVLSVRSAAFAADLNEMLMTIKSKGSSEVDSRVEVLRAYGSDLQTESVGFNSRATLPIPVADKIANSPNNWPSALLLLAEKSLQGPSDKTVKDIAAEEDWFI